MISKRSPFIKICGLTDPLNAVECAHLGADAIGLVFYEKSPRFVSDDIALQISKALPDIVITTGVFVDEDYDHIMRKVDKCQLKSVQLHGNESPGLVSQLRDQNLVVVKALFAAKTPYLMNASSFEKASFILVEYGKGKLPGGNAETWNYEITNMLKTDTPVILAGGLTADNILEAIESVHPQAVDVSSGVEACPGVKDINKVKLFIDRVRSV